MEELPAKRILIGLLTLSILLVISSSYTLDGDWELTPQHLNYTSSSPNTTFAFRKKIVTTALQPPQDVLGGPTTNVVHKGTSQLTVHACRTLTYNYYINENSMYLQKVRSSGEVRPCLPKELQELEWKLNSTFTFAIQNNKLVLFSPCNTAHLVLNRTTPPYLSTPPGGYSQWRITSINGSNLVDKKEQTAFINQTHAELCNFQGLVNYTIDQNNIIRVNVEKNNCKNSNITKLFKEAQFEIKTQRKSTFFDKQLNQIGTLHFDKNINKKTFNALKNQAAAETLKAQNQGQSQATNSLNTVNNNITQSTNNQNQANNQNPQTNTQGNIQPKINTSGSTPKTDTTRSTPKTNTSGNTPTTNTSASTPKANTTGSTPKTNTSGSTPQTNNQTQTTKTNNQTQTPKTNTQTQIPKTNTQGNVQPPITNIQGNTQTSIQGNIQPKANTQSGTPKTNTQSNTPKTNSQNNTPKTNTSVSISKTNTSRSTPKTNTSSPPKTNTSTSTPKTDTSGSTPKTINQTQTPKTNIQAQAPKANTQGNNQGSVQPPTASTQGNTQNIQAPPPPQKSTQGNTKNNSVNPTNQQSQASNSNSSSTRPSTTQTSTEGHSFFLPYKASSKVCKCYSVSGVDALQSFDQKLMCNKWFLYAINGSDHNIDQYFYYFLIITQERMIYYGGCEVRWSPYNIKNNVLSGIGTSRFPKSEQQCIKKNIDNQVLQPFFDQVKYVDFAQNQDIPYILFYDKDLNHLATFHTETPNFPPVQE